MRQLIATAFLISGVATAPVSAQEPVATAFVDVSVIPMDSERVLSNHTVLVRGSRITALGPASTVPVPAEARRIDGRDKFLIPGLADMHSHVGPANRVALFLYLANGVTAIHLESGKNNLKRLRALADSGALVPPRYFGLGDFPDCRTNPRFADTSLVGCLAKMKAARLADGHPVPDDSSDHAIVRRMQLGNENHPPKTLEEFERALQFRWKYFDHLLTYHDYVIGSQLPFYGWSNVRLDTASWMRSGYQLPPKRLHHIVEATRRAGTWNIPTLAVKEFFIHRTEPYPGYKQVTQRRFDFDLQILKALSDAGAGLLLGADRFDMTAGFTIHRELQLFVQAGLTPYQALEAGTRNVAVFFGTQDRAGTIAVGKHADLVLLEGNPLQDIRYAAGPAGVMADGRWLSRADIHARLDALEARGCPLADLRREAWQHLGISRQKNTMNLCSDLDLPSPQGNP